MNKFEYKIIVRYDFDLEHELNKHGKDGWELSSVILEGTKYVLFLKRKYVIEIKGKYGYWS